MPSHGLIPHSDRPPLIATRQERAIARRVDKVNGQAVVARAHDVAARELAKGRISDIAAVGRHALNEALGLEHDYKAASDASPFESALLRGITEDIGNGIRYEARSFIKGD